MPNIRRSVLSKEKIVLAALKLSGKKGLSAVTIRELASALGRHNKTLYDYYPSRDHIIDDMLDMLAKRLIGIYRNRGSKNWDEHLRNCFTESFKLHIQFRIVGDEIIARSGRVPHSLVLVSTVVDILADAGFTRDRALVISNVLISEHGMQLRRALLEGDKVSLGARLRAGEILSDRPEADENLREITKYRNDKPIKQLQAGLDFILAGARALLASETPPAVKNEPGPVKERVKESAR